MEIIGGLSFLGKYMNSRNDKKDLDKQIEINDANDSDADNIYSRKMFSRANKKYLKLANDRYAKSQNPEKTGVISRDYKLQKKYKDDKRKSQNFETFSSVSDNSSMCSNNSIDMDNPCFFLDKSKKVFDNRKNERKFVQKIQDDDNYNAQFGALAFNNSGAPVSANAVPNTVGMDSAVMRMENERSLALDGGYSNFGEASDMTYDVVDKENFTHNNMVPFHRRGANELTREHQAMVNQRKMESFSGLRRDGWKNKVERAPLFDPITNIANIYGTPNMTDFYQSRMTPGRERRNEKPFQPIKVAPGIGLGANASGGNFTKGGGDISRVLPPTVDDLRTAQKKKVSYEGVMNIGQKGNNGPVIGNVEKRRPEKFKILNNRNLLKPYGYIQAPKITGEIDPNTLGSNNRGLIRRVQYGPAQHENTKITTDDMRGNYRESFKESFEQAESRGFHFVEGLRGRSGSADDTYIPDITQREQTNNYNGPLGHSSTNKGQYYDSNDTTKVTMRTVHNQTNQIGNAIQGDYQQGQYFDPNDTTKITMRNIHDQTDRSGKTIQGDYQQGQYYDPNDTTKITMRNIHDQTDRSGKAMIGEYQQGQYYDPNDTTKITMRNIHDQTDREGKAIQGDYQQGQYWDPNDVTNINMRNIHDKTDRNGKAVQGEYQQGQYWDPNDVTNINMRNIHDRTDRNGKAVQGDYQQGQYYDPNDVTKITMRNIHDKTDRNGKAVQGDYQKGQYYDPNDITKITMRNIHDQTDRNGKAVQGDYQKGQYYDPNDVTKINMRNIHDQTDRSGKTINGDYQKGQYYDPNDITKVTMRTVHNQTDRSGKAMNGDYQKGQYYDPNDTTKVTMRTVHNQTDRSGKAVNGDYQKGQYYDPNDTTKVTMRTIHNKTDIGPMQNDIPQAYTINYINATPDITIREMTGKTNRIGAANHDVNNSYVINYENATPDITIREMTGETNHANPARSEVSSPRNRRDVYNARVNVSKENIAKGRSPTTSNYDKGPNNYFTEFRFRDPDQLNRQFAPNAIQQTTNHLPFAINKNKNPKTYINNRINSYPQENLENNPYVNNVIHQSKIIYN